MANNYTKSVGRNFDPYLVGNQWTSEGGTPLFTIGNFQITTNLTPAPKRNFQLGNFSEPLTLNNLGTTLSEATQFVDYNLNIYLNLDTQNLLNFNLFGSFVQFVENTLNQIINNWPGSIYVFYSYGSVFGNTVENYVYNSATNQSTFDVSTNFFYNDYGVNFLSNALSYTGTSMPNTIKNLSVFYGEYVIDVNGQTYKILNFVGSSTYTNGTCTFTVEGDPFNGGPTSTQSYHIRPNNVYLERFFSSLDDFPRFLLNRNTTPIYTCNIYYEEQTENYLTFQRVKRFTWPVTDGYNLDRNTGDFSIYRQALLEIATSYDEYRTDLMRRVLVTESVSYFELNPRINSYYPINTTDKIDKLLNIYGVEFDQIKNYIDGISFATVVSYNKQGNTPDALIKDFAYYLGWDMLSPMNENDLLSDFMPSASYYPGMTVGYTPAEAEVEFWRRLILNSAFLWKSKGTRKGIEFIFDFINTPPALVNFNEYIYQAKNKLDINLFKKILGYLYNDTSIEDYNIDEDGYPKVPVDTLQNYFQKGGGWYRETAGANSQIDFYEGNNPHIGPYDGGQYYIDRFRCLLDGFSGQTVKITDEYVEFRNVFTNYYDGVVNNYEGEIFVEAVDTNNRPSVCSSVSGTVIDNPSNEPELTICGCAIPSAITKAILITVEKINFDPPCDINDGGTVTGTTGGGDPCKGLTFISPFIWRDASNNIVTRVPKECCEREGGTFNPTTGECYDPNLTGFTSPCPPNLIFNGTNGNYLVWEDNSTTPPTLTSSVPFSCCTGFGGYYNSINGLCQTGSTIGTGTNTGTTSGITGEALRIQTCSDFCVTTTQGGSRCGCLPPSPVLTLYKDPNTPLPNAMLYIDQALQIRFTGSYFVFAGDIYFAAQGINTQICTLNTITTC